MKKRIASVFLALMMIACMLPVGAVDSGTNVNEIAKFGFADSKLVEGSISETDQRLNNGYTKISVTQDVATKGKKLYTMFYNPSIPSRPVDLTSCLFKEAEKQSGSKSDAVISFYVKSPINCTLQVYFYHYKNSTSQNSTSKVAVDIGNEDVNRWKQVVIPMQDFTRTDGSETSSFSQCVIYSYDPAIKSGTDFLMTPMSVYDSGNIPKYCDADSFTLDSTNLTLSSRENANLTPQFSTKNVGYTPVSEEVLFTTSNEFVATVDAGGTVTACGQGEAVITAEAQNTKLRAECKVTVSGELATENKVSYTRDEYKTADDLLGNIYNLPLDATKNTRVQLFSNGTSSGGNHFDMSEYIGVEAIKSNAVIAFYIKGNAAVSDLQACFFSSYEAAYSDTNKVSISIDKADEWQLVVIPLSSFTYSKTDPRFSRFDIIVPQSYTSAAGAYLNVTAAEVYTANPYNEVRIGKQQINCGVSHYKTGDTVKISLTDTQNSLVKSGTLNTTYNKSGITVTEGLYQAITEDGNTFSFLMPNSPVRVDAEFINKAEQDFSANTIYAKSYTDESGTQTGLRFTNRILLPYEQNEYGNTLKYNGKAYTVSDIGMLIVPEDILMGKELNVNFEAVNIVSATASDDTGAKYVKSSGATQAYIDYSVRIKNAIAGRNYVCRSFVKLYDADTASEIYVYGDLFMAQRTGNADEVEVITSLGFQNQCIYEADFVKGIWSDVKDGSFSYVRTALGSENENYYRFKNTLDYQINDQTAYYSNVDKRFTMLYGDIVGKYDSEYLKLNTAPCLFTSTLRFWVKSPRAGIALMVGFCDGNYNTVKYNYTVDTENEWVEIQIPIKDIVSQKTSFNYKQIRNIIFSAGVGIASTAQEALKSGEIIKFGYFQIWTGEPKKAIPDNGVKYYSDCYDNQIYAMDQSNAVPGVAEMRFIFDNNSDEFTQLHQNITGANLVSLLNIYGIDLEKGMTLKSEQLNGSLSVSISKQHTMITSAQNTGVCIIGKYKNGIIIPLKVNSTGDSYQFEINSFDKIAILSVTEETASMIENGVITEFRNPNYTVPQEAAVELRISVEEHPGVPNNDIEYPVSVYTNGNLGTDNYILSCNKEGVTVSNNSVFVPKNLVVQGETMLITATSLIDGRAHESYPIKFRRWEATLNDEFEGDSLNDSVWGFRESWDSEENEKSNPDMAIVSDGNLILKADKQSYNGAEYSHIFLDTKDKFTQTYGCFTTSIKVADKGGTNTAFWMLPNRGDWGNSYLYKKTSEDKWCGEIDILEVSPAESWASKYQSTLHYWNCNGGAASDYHERNYFEDLHTGFHEYSCVWTEKALYMYYDGKLIYSVIGIEATDNPAYMVLDLELGAKAGTGIYDWCGTYTDNDLPIYAYVDFVKVYK